MRNLFLLASLMSLTLSMFGQGGSNGTNTIDPGPIRGPINISSPGVIDGVVLNDEVPLASKVEYEHVRLSDYVWSKRVFSRIDAREKMNQSIFYPYDYFNQEEEIWQPPTQISEIDKKDWVKHQERYSLWTIIMRHIMLSDLTVFEVSNPDFPTIEDGYQLKYPISSSMGTDYPFFEDMTYRKKIIKMISYGSKGPIWFYDNADQPVAGQEPYKFTDVSESFEDWLKKQETNPENVTHNNEFQTDKEKSNLKAAYLKAIEEYKQDKNKGDALHKSDLVRFISSQSISAYNIKEDWFFDKERSLLDKRIIAIAPVGRYRPAVDPSEGIMRFDNFVEINSKGEKMAGTGNGVFGVYDGATFETEMFWLYFPELRNYIVNYYVYNDKSDAQWMSFDDLFWKRRFTGQIYKSSNRFDQDIEDYRYGVDALYQAEQFKNTMRNWEHDVWNY